MPTIEVNGVHTELLPKEEIMPTINDMISQANTNLLSGKTKGRAKRQAEERTISFFGSVKHYLEGGAEL